MTTSDDSWSGKLRLIGDLERPDHTFLTAEDTCWFFGEYTPRAGYAHSQTNGLINNLKKPINTRGTPQWKYKERAIATVATAIRRNLNAGSHATIVPIPPSKLPDAPDYDARMVQVARSIGQGVEVRDMLVAVAEREARHTIQGRRDPEELRKSLGFHPSGQRDPAPSRVILLDDVLTTGCSFSVCKAMIHELWPDAAVYGLFVARRVPQQMDPADWLDDLDQ